MRIASEVFSTVKTPRSRKAKVMGVDIMERSHIIEKQR